jgi:hypothetical protein
VVVAQMVVAFLLVVATQEVATVQAIGWRFRHNRDGF